jgi:diguanylate cyclase (GGDEF)-like protein/PAS domain S-box-containing protein
LPRNAVWRALAGWVAILLCLGVYWFELNQTHRSQLDQVEANVRLRAEQTVHALALQVSTMVEKLDYLTLQLGQSWLAEGERTFRRTVSVAQHALPEGAVVQVAIASERGEVLFSSLVPEDATVAATKVSIADRSHFAVHLNRAESGLYISHPVLGRISGKWTVQFSRPLHREGRLEGVIVVSVSAEHLSRALRDIFPDPADVALLLRDDGAYLARSHLLEGVLGKSVPADRRFLHDHLVSHGFYDVVAPVDGVERYYAWRRVQDRPLVVSLGLSKSAAMATVRESVRSSGLYNLVATVALLLAALWITRLYLLKSRQTAALAQAGERLEFALEGGDLGTWDWNCVTGENRCNTRWARMLGYAPGEAAPDFATWDASIHPDDRKQVHEALHAHLRAETRQYQTTYRMLRRDGETIWVLDRGRVVSRDEAGRPLRVAGTLLDITERHVVEAALDAERLRLTTLLQRFPGGVLMEDAAGRVTIVNRGMCELLGIGDDPAALQGLPHDALCARVGPQRAAWLNVPDARSEGERRRSVELTDADGRSFEIDWLPIMRDQRQLGRVWLVRDVSDRKQRETALATLASTDALTALPNRRSFMSSLEAASSTLRSNPERQGVLLMIDIDYFKRVNDTYGHAVGDKVLCHVADLIRNGLRQQDAAARLGGEEFSALLLGVAPADARLLADRLRVRIAESSVDTGEGRVAVTVSIGLAALDSAGAEVALKRADRALYAAKAGGRNQVRGYTGEQP